MASYHDRWLIADAASIALQDVIDNPKKYDLEDFDKEAIYECLSCWIKRFPGKPSVDPPKPDKILYARLRIFMPGYSRVVGFDPDDVLRAGVGRLDNRSL